MHIGIFPHIAAIIWFTGEGQKDQDQGEADEATIRLVKMVTVESVEAELGLTSLPVLDSATTTSYMASQ